MSRDSSSDTTLATEVVTALDELLIRRGRGMMLVGVAATIAFILTSHLMGLARVWSNVMNAGVGVLLAATFLLSNRPALQRNMLGICILLGVTFGGVRALAGIWHGDVAATAIFNAAGAGAPGERRRRRKRQPLKPNRRRVRGARLRQRRRRRSRPAGHGLRSRDIGLSMPEHA
jgi:hypothetical protein